MESKSEGDIWELEGWVQQVDKTRQQLGNREVGVTSGVDLRDTWEAEMTGCGHWIWGGEGKAMR